MFRTVKLGGQGRAVSPCVPYSLTMVARDARAPNALLQKIQRAVNGWLQPAPRKVSAKSPLVTMLVGRIPEPPRERDAELECGLDGVDDEVATALLRRQVTNELAKQALLADMRSFLQAHPSSRLADWALASEWARGTGGSVDPAGAPVRVLSGEWLECWKIAAADEEERTRGCPQHNSAAEPKTFGECTICLEPLTSLDARTALPCAHVFHTACVRGWFKSPCCTERSCPVCAERI